MDQSIARQEFPLRIASQVVKNGITDLESNSGVCLHPQRFFHDSCQESCVVRRFLIGLYFAEQRTQFGLSLKNVSEFFIKERFVESGRQIRHLIYCSHPRPTDDDHFETGQHRTIVSTL
jgi:hypothetical protein